ncbi:hypothetical protein [Sphingomonas sp. RS2018]
MEGTDPHDRIEIRGNGFLVYGDQGNAEGWFNEPPMMLLDEDPAPPATDDQQDDYDCDRAMNAQPKLSPEYQRAAWTSKISRLNSGLVGCGATTPDRDHYFKAY